MIVLLIWAIGRFTFSHGGNRNKRGHMHVTLMVLVALSSVFGALMWSHGTLKIPS